MSGLNNHIANIADVVQWGLGLLHQQAIFENEAKGDIEKMSKQGPVCTACHSMFDSKCCACWI